MAQFVFVQDDLQVRLEAHTNRDSDSDLEERLYLEDLSLIPMRLAISGSFDARTWTSTRTAVRLCNPYCGAWDLRLPNLSTKAHQRPRWHWAIVAAKASADRSGWRRS